MDVPKSKRRICMDVLLCRSFDDERRRRWIIWGAKHQNCPTCLVNMGEPCLNLTDVKNKMVYKPRVNRTPHTDRIDWDRIYQGLVQRGWIKETK